MEIGFDNIGNMVSIIVITCLIVFMAMMIDLGAGLYKAKLRGEIRSSWGLKRSINKFIMYEGSMLIAAGVDFLIHFSNVLQLIGLKLLIGIPFVTCMVGIFSLVVEFLSIREKADKKTKKEVENAIELLTKVLSSEKLVEVLQAIEKEKGVRNES